jgi:hypothetical protein
MTTESDIPKVFLSIKCKDYDGMLGSYCWGNICITKTMPSSIKDDVRKIQLQRKDTVVIRVQNFSNPEKFNVTIFNERGTLIMNKDFENEFDVDIQKGQYILSVLASWMYKGDVSYLFPIDIE